MCALSLFDLVLTWCCAATAIDVRRAYVKNGDDGGDGCCDDDDDGACEILCASGHVWSGQTFLRASATHVRGLPSRPTSSCDARAPRARAIAVAARPVASVLANCSFKSRLFASRSVARARCEKDVPLLDR